MRAALFASLFLMTACPDVSDEDPQRDETDADTCNPHTVYRSCAATGTRTALGDPLTEIDKHWNDEGYILRALERQDGETTRDTRWTWDGSRLVSILIETDGETTVITYTPSDDGRTETIRSRNGGSDVVIVRTLNADGREIARTTDYQDDGVVDLTCTREWHDTGPWTYTERCDLADGGPSHVQHAELDRWDNPLHTEQLLEGADTPDEERTWVYTDDCQVQRSTYTSTDFLSQVSATFDASGRIRESESHAMMDGTEVSSSTETWTYDCP